MNNRITNTELKYMLLLVLIPVVIILITLCIPEWLKNSDYRNYSKDYFYSCVGTIDTYKSIMDECLYNFDDIASNDCANTVLQDIQLSTKRGSKSACKYMEIKFNEDGYEIIAEPLSDGNDESCKICATEQTFQYPEHDADEAYNLYKKNCKKSRDVECLHK